MIRRLAFLLLASGLLSGCYMHKAKDDSPWDLNKVAQITIGQTTKAEVLQLLGPPRRVVRLLDSEALEYEHTIEKSTGFFIVVLAMRRSDRQRDAVTVLVDRKGVVQAVGSSMGAEKASFGTPFGD